MGAEEIKVMLSGEEIGGYKIKPWSLGRFHKILVPLLALLKPLKELGLSFEMDEAALTKFLLGNGIEIILLTPELLNVMALIIAGSLDISEQEARDMNLEQMLSIMAAILSQNFRRLKNSLPLIMGQLKEMIRAA